MKSQLVALAVLSVACGAAAQEGPRMTPSADGSVTVPIRVLERQLVSGVRDPRLPEDVKQDFVRVAVTDPRVLVELCLDPDGIPSKVEVRASSNHDLADALAVDTVREWRFSRTVIDGRPVRVCTVVTFKWRIPFPPKREPSPIPF